MHNGVCYNRRVGNEADKDKMKQAEDAQATRAGLVVLARLIARCHLQRIRGFEMGDDAEHSEHSTEGRGNG